MLVVPSVPPYPCRDTSVDAEGDSLHVRLILSRLQLRTQSLSSGAGAWVFILAFVALLVARRATLTLPPAFDSAMSVWPASIELARRDFDFRAVLALPTYVFGGPNAHTLSLVTLLTAGLLETLGPQATIVTLHITNIALLALTATAVFRIVARCVDRRHAWLAAIAVSSIPVMIAQTAYLYTEIPCCAAFTWSMDAALRDRPRRAAALLALAVAVKPIALIGVPLLVVLGVLQSHRWRQFALATLLPTAALVPALLVPSGPGKPAFLRLLTTIMNSWVFMRSVPDLALLIVGSLLIAWAADRRLRRGLGGSRAQQMLFAAGAALVPAFVCFFLFASLGTATTFVLPRYLVLVLPMVIAVVATGARILTPRLSIATLVLLIGFFAANHRGDLYKNNTVPAFPVQERSMAFVDLVDLYSDGISRLVDMSERTPIVYDHFTHYALRYPEMGYAASDEISGYPTLIIQDLQGRPLQLEDLPNRFAILAVHPAGGGRAYDLLQEASATEEWTVSREVLSRGPFTATLAVVQRVTPRAEIGEARETPKRGLGPL